jgi:hypothetical protein
MHNTKAALLFITDAAAIPNHGQLAIETFAKSWYIPASHVNGRNASKLYGQYISGSFDVSEHLQATIGGIIGYGTKKHSSVYSNLIFQVKAKIFDIATFAGYNIVYNSLHRQIQWIQLGVRKVLN